MNKHSISQFIKQYYPEFWGYQRYPADHCAAIHKLTDEWGILHNMAHTPIIVQGVTFKCAEQLFQTMKFITKEDVQFIYRTNNKKNAQRLENEDKRRSDWGKMIIDAIKFCLVQKYEQCEDFRKELERSKGLFIVEDESNRRKTPTAWAAVREGNEFVGPSILGRLLMELRDTGTLSYHLPDDALDFIEYLK